MADDSIDYNLFALIQPPSVYPPTSHALNAKIQETFYQECLHFLSSQKKLHSISTRIEDRLSSSISDSVSLDLHINQSVEKLERIARELKKISQHYEQAEEKQQFLASVCKFVNMQQARTVMLEPKISDEAKFLQKLQEVGDIAQQVSNLNSDIKIITQIKEQISTLMQEAVDKLIKGNISENLIEKITSSHSEIFLREPKISSIFLSSLTNHRLNLFRVGLNPLINNINYVQNLSELFEKIIQQWLKLLQNEINIFQKESTPKEIRNITKDVMLKLLGEIIPKMERGIYKVKNLVEVSKIRACMMKLKETLDRCSPTEVLWDPLPKLLVKMLIILEEGLEAEAQKLETAKYNIYSLISYIPIREHLELIKQSKSQDPDNKQLDWERGFKRLAASRNPSKQPNNKSLIIFNLNIWYLYSHLMKPDGELIGKADSMIKEGVNGLIGLNLNAIKKDYDTKNIQKLLDMCSDVAALKKLLYSEIILLGHEKLRQALQHEIDNRFIKQVYVPMLQAHKLQQGLNNEQVVELCKKQKLNLNKYGKVSETLKIFTAEQMQQLIK